MQLIGQSLRTKKEMSRWFQLLLAAKVDCGRKEEEEEEDDEEE